MDDDLTAKLIAICEINSGTDNQAGVRAVQSTVLPWFDPIVDQTETVRLPDRVWIEPTGNTRRIPVADAVVLRRRTVAARQVLLGIHLDTVYGAHHPFQAVTRPAPNVLRGPGVADAKGGLIVMLGALTALENRVAAGDAVARSIGWTVFLNPDEETGSTSSVELLNQLARAADFGMVYEPALPDGTLIHARKGSGNYEVVVRGQSAHAGREIASGRNAISALCRFLGELERLHRDDGSVTVNLGRVTGGGPLNVVPDLAIGGWNVRVSDQSAADWVQREIRRCVDESNTAVGIRLSLYGGMTSPPKPLDQRSTQLFDRIIETGERMGLTIRTAESGGVCDGNKLAAAGCPTVDTLGPRGGNLHSDQEYVLVDSLDERAKLSEALLMEFARHPEGFPTRS